MTGCGAVGSVGRLCYPQLTEFLCATVFPLHRSFM
jgi:hypothetical protein